MFIEDIFYPIVVAGGVMHQTQPQQQVYAVPNSQQPQYPPNYYNTQQQQQQPQYPPNYQFNPPNPQVNPS